MTLSMFGFELLKMFLIYFGIFVISLVFTIYLYFRYSYTYWARKGVPYIRPKFPFGNNDGIGPAAVSYGIETVDWYNELKRKGHKLGGAWSWAKPVLVLTDPNYIKDVLLKDFQYFIDRDFYQNAKHDPKNASVFTVQQGDWKNIRQKLTPTFTSAKMKMMFDSVVNCSEPLIELIDNKAKAGVDIDIKEQMASFTIDVIGCIAFGLEGDSFKNRDSKFRQVGKDIFKPSLVGSIEIILSRVCETIAKNIGVTNTPRHITDFFVDVVKSNIEYRKKNNIKRQDFTQLLMELQESTKNDLKPFSFDELVANTIIFFFAGFDTSSITMTMALYELARNPDLQEKTRNEINKVLEKHKGEMTYEGFQEMTYLRQVVDETLRLYTPVHALSRISTKPYQFKDTNFTIEKGTTVIISAMALGRDPDYFPDPEKFNPDRFTPENKASRNAYVYLPFGEGPRNCIGMRFGIMQASIGLIRILKNFEIEISSSTKMPLTLKKGSFSLQSNETLYVKARKIK